PLPVRSVHSLSADEARERSCPSDRSHPDPQAFTENLKHRCSDFVRALAGVEHGKALGFLGGHQHEASPHALMKFQFERFKTLCFSTLCSSSQPCLHREVEEQCQIRFQIPDGKAIKRTELLKIETMAVALIGIGRVDKAVAKHPFTAL